MQPPVIYYGGKVRLASTIAAMLPTDHRHYVEPYAGSAAVLLAKTPSVMETINDVDGDLMCWWRVLREAPADLARICAFTPHSRAEHDAAYGDLTGLDDLERARRVWIRLTQGRAGTLRRTGWRHYVDGAASSLSMPGYLSSYLNRFAPVAERLHQVSLECGDALDLIATYGSKRSTLLYVDPPYPAATHRARNYAHEMTDEDSHRALAEALHAASATVVLSGYACPLYDRDLYPDWYRYELTAYTQGARTARTARTEVLWSNRPLNTTSEAPTLDLGDTPFRDASTGERHEITGRCGADDCRAVMRQSPRGRKRKYCSDACRARELRRRNRDGAKR